ncbi:MAG: hypothetical protein EBQ54_01020, partial [Actinobacteria bacterium]|nr:hypothetical protein [Actinomycetota bacterium]
MDPLLRLRCAKLVPPVDGRPTRSRAVLSVGWSGDEIYMSAWSNRVRKPAAKASPAPVESMTSL